MLEDAIIEDGKRFRIAGACQNDEATEGAGLDAVFLHGQLAAGVLLMVVDIELLPQGKDAVLGYHSGHGPPGEAAVQFGPGRGRHEVHTAARRKLRRPFEGPLTVRLIQHVYTVRSGDKPLDILIIEQKHKRPPWY